MELKNGLILAGVLLCFLISASIGQETKDPQDAEDMEDDYSYDNNNYDYSTDEDYEDKDDKLTTAASVKTATTPPMLTTTTTTTTTTEELDIFADICPPKCECTDDIQFINCSYRNFTDIPMALPSSALTIDLSFNLIHTIPSWIFENCTRVQKILLNNNQIRNINESFITREHRLDYLDLSSNNLTTIMPNTFIDAIDLTTLKLNFNPIKLPENELFLNIPELIHLNMTDCNLTNIYNETFEKFTQLISLDLRNNQFVEDINVVGFKPMKNLQILKFSSMPEKHIRELCMILAAIDEISSDKYVISCLILVSGSTFEDSTVTDGPPKQKPSIDENNNEYESIIEPIIQKPKKQEQNNEQDNVKSITKTNSKLNNNNNQTNIDNNNFDLNYNQNLTDINNKTSMMAGSDVSNVEKMDSSSTNSVNISSQTLKTILIGTIGVAIIGLIIGIICRRDVCGIKTKMCRRRRPLPTDQIRPAEQVPLNKVASS